MTGTELIPASAWVQAVFVCLFIVIIVILFSYFGKQVKESRDFQKAESDSNREFQKQESDKWQRFISDQNLSFQKFNREQREDNNSCLADVNKGLTNLTQATQGLANEVKEMRTESREISAALALHDDQAKEILHAVTKPAPKARVKPQ